MFLNALDMLGYDIVTFINLYGLYYLYCVVTYAVLHSLVSGLVNHSWSYESIIQALLFPISIANSLGILILFIKMKLQK